SPLWRSRDRSARDPRPAAPAQVAATVRVRFATPGTRPPAYAVPPIPRAWQAISHRRRPRRPTRQPSKRRRPRQLFASACRSSEGNSETYAIRTRANQRQALFEFRRRLQSALAGDPALIPDIFYGQEGAPALVLDAGLYAADVVRIEIVVVGGTPRRQQLHGLLADVHVIRAIVSITPCSQRPVVLHVGRARRLWRIGQLRADAPVRSRCQAGELGLQQAQIEAELP